VGGQNRARRGLSAGGDRIRTIGPAEKERPAADHRRLARRPVLDDPIQLIGPASLVGNSRETFHESGTEGSNPVPSSEESCELRYGRTPDPRSQARNGEALHTVVIVAFDRVTGRVHGNFVYGSHGPGWRRARPGSGSWRSCGAVSVVSSSTPWSFRSISRSVVRSSASTHGAASRSSEPRSRPSASCAPESLPNSEKRSSWWRMR